MKSISIWDAFFNFIKLFIILIVYNTSNKKNIMKKIALFIALVCSTMIAIAQTKAPSTTVQTATGSSIAFNKIAPAGQVTLVSFWANWCIPCKKEIKTINEKMDSWKQQGAKFSYVLVSVDDAKSIDGAKAYISKQGYKIPAYYDTNQSLKKAIGFQNVPFTAIVDKKGNIVYTHSGFDADAEAKILQKLKELSK